MKLNKIVAQFKDKTLVKGRAFDFSMNKTFFCLETLDGDVMDIAVDKLKAVFFVKDYFGNKNRHDRYHDKVPGGGRMIEVRFQDGEVITGFSHGYHQGRSGFFLTPAYRKGNNYRIFVVTSSTREVTEVAESLETDTVSVPSFAFN